ncbi:MAG: VacJ family lipoprotein [Gammaproteobacteria bacterium]|nr:MAG: VacJ family lipoprotein [Gammaproteobacteria bacterium]
MNRRVYAFNDALDRRLMRPVARQYRRIVPRPVRRGVGNFFTNLHTPVVLANDLLQGKPGAAAGDLARLMFNTSVGLLGVLDVAGAWGLPAHREDFGQTFARWGAGGGAYLVLPFLGPSTVRDTAGLLVEFAVDPLYSSLRAFGLLSRKDAQRYGLMALEAVQLRAQLLGASRVLETAALDPYLFTREAYRQRRLDLIYDGHPPAAGPEGADEEGPGFDDFDEGF